MSDTHVDVAAGIDVVERIAAENYQDILIFFQAYDVVAFLIGVVGIVLDPMGVSSANRTPESASSRRPKSTE